MPPALLTVILWQLHIFKIKTKICKNQPLTTQTKTAVQYTKLLCARYLLQTTALLEPGLDACKAACYEYAKKYLSSGNLRAPMQFFLTMIQEVLANCGRIAGCACSTLIAANCGCDGFQIRLRYFECGRQDQRLCTIVLT